MNPRYTAAGYLGAIGYGAGPTGADLPPGAQVGPAVPAGQPSTTKPGPLDDPAFWIVAVLGAVIGLASVSRAG